MVTEQRFRERLSVGPVPSRPTRARITLRYHPPARGPEEGGADRAGIESLTDSFDTLRAIADRGFLGARGVTVTVGAPRPEHLVVELEAEDLPWGLVVIALRIVVSANDADPAAFQELLAALDGDLETATRIYAGVDFDEVAEIDLRLEGAASPAAVDGAQPDGAHLDGTQLSAVPLDPVWLDASAKDVVQVTRLVLPGLAASMPSGELEDLLLRLAALRAFWPIGLEADAEPGDEEYHVIGEDLVVDHLSIEDASLRAILTLLASARQIGTPRWA